MVDGLVESEVGVRPVRPATCRRAPSPPSRAPARTFRVIRGRTDAKTAKTSTETAHGITSVSTDRAGPERLPAWNRGHRQVQNGNHHRHDASMGEDASRIRARHAPANPTTSR